jgi:hypothetical protein
MPPECYGLFYVVAGNTVQHATIEEAVFSVDPTDTPINWLNSGHMTFTVCPCLGLGCISEQNS